MYIPEYGKPNVANFNHKKQTFDKGYHSGGLFNLNRLFRKTLA